MAELDFSFVTWQFVQDYLLKGLYFTLFLTSVATIGGIFFGTILALMRLSGTKFLEIPASIYINGMRSIPLVMVILWFFLLVPPSFYSMIGVPTTSRAEASAIITFIAFQAAYFAEIVRAGIQSIDRGQYEGAKVLGMNYVQTMRRIILPQVIRIILPPISNETITLVKDTSLVYVLAMNDLMRTARNLVQRDFSITPFIVAAVFYLLATLILTLVFERLEKRFSRYDQ